jgi:hypothetical protein
MGLSKETYKRKIKNCEHSIREKLFLASNDLITYNITNRILYLIYLILDFIFLAHYPLAHLYSYSKSGIIENKQKI